MGARYSRHAGYTVARRNTTQRTPTRTVSRRFKLGPNTARYIGLAVLAIIGLVVVTQSNNGVTRQYSDQKVTQSLAQENASIEALKLEAQRAQSLSAITQSAQKDSMVPIGSDVTHVSGDVAGATTATPSPTP